MLGQSVFPLMFYIPLTLRQQLNIGDYGVSFTVYTVIRCGAMPRVCGMVFKCGSTMTKVQVLQAGTVTNKQTNKQTGVHVDTFTPAWRNVPFPGGRARQCGGPFYLEAGIAGARDCVSRIPFTWCDRAVLDTYKRTFSH